MNDSRLADSRSQQGELWKMLYVIGSVVASNCTPIHSDESFTVGTGISFLQGILFFSN